MEQLVLLYALIACFDVVLIFLNGIYGDAEILDKADKLASVSACVITFFGFVFIYRQLRLQADGSDIASILTISSQINAATFDLNFNCLDTAGNIDRTKWVSVFRNLLTIYESACFSYNEGMLQEKARYLLGGYLRNGLDLLHSNPDLRQWMDSVRAETPGALKEIDRFRTAR